MTIIIVSYLIVSALWLIGNVLLSKYSRIDYNNEDVSIFVALGVFLWPLALLILLIEYTSVFLQGMFKEIQKGKY